MVSSESNNALEAHWKEQGYILKQGVIGRTRVENLLEYCDSLLDQFFIRDPDQGEPGDPNGRVMRHLNRPEYREKDPAGFIQLMETVADRDLLSLLRTILGAEPIFRTISYWYHPQSGGREGNWHRDSQFLFPDEAEERRQVEKASPQQSVQLMLALLPTEDNEFVPGSHLRWDTEAEYRIRLGEDGKNRFSSEMPGAVRLRQEPGDVLVFNPYGLHRGRYRADIPRRTLMFTYNSPAGVHHNFFPTNPGFSMRITWRDYPVPPGTFFNPSWIPIENPGRRNKNKKIPQSYSGGLGIGTIFADNIGIFIPGWYSTSEQSSR